MNPPKEIRALLPVDQLITREQRDAESRKRRMVLAVLAVTGWVFFALSVALSGCR